jgi:transposase-like protein
LSIILTGIASLEQHILTVIFQPDAYRPHKCPHCGKTGLWHHGSYHRKPDRCNTDNKSLNPISIPRFLCPTCTRSCSVLPQCIPPRRWYLWEIQHVVLCFIIAGGGLRTAARKWRIHIKTLRRWIQRLNEQFHLHADALKTANPELGRCVGFTEFWCQCLQEMTLSQAMMIVQKQAIDIP